MLLLLREGQIAKGKSTVHLLCNNKKNWPRSMWNAIEIIWKEDGGYIRPRKGANWLYQPIISPVGSMSQLALVVQSVELKRFYFSARFAWKSIGFCLLSIYIKCLLFGVMSSICEPKTWQIKTMLSERWGERVLFVHQRKNMCGQCCR